MKNFIFAIDVDGTLIDIDSRGNKPTIDEDIRTLLVILATKFKNVKVVVWSGGGELYARQVGSILGIDKYVSEYRGKELNTDTPTLKPAVAIDDVDKCELGVINLILKRQ